MENKKRENIEFQETLVRLAQERTELSKERNRLAGLRTKMSAHRSYMNTERTLSVWIRTALAIMVFGIAVDRFGLMLNIPETTAVLFWSSPSAAIGAGLVVLSMIMVTTAALKFLRSSKQFKSEHQLPPYHSITLPVFYATMVDLVGIALFVLMLDL